MAVQRRDGHLEDAADDLVVFEYVEVVLIPADRRAFDDQLGHGVSPPGMSPLGVAAIRSWARSSARSANFS